MTAPLNTRDQERPDSPRSLARGSSVSTGLAQSAGNVSGINLNEVILQSLEN